MTLGRLQELRGYIDPGPWRLGRSDFDGSLMLFDSEGNPIALIYGGHDLGLYLEACAPDTLLGAKP
jgi:hypothetical protein